MIELNRASLDKYIRSVGVRQIRLACGLVLFAYLLSHFINHALGNISLDALATGVSYHTAFWKSLPITTVFYAAAAAHAGLGLWALYQRRQFHWKAIEPIQLVLGLSIPALIITHLAGVRIDDVLFQHQNPQVFYSYWIIWPYKMWLMFIVLIVSWVHGCIGLYFWFQMKASSRRRRRFCWRQRYSFQRLPCSAFIKAAEGSCMTAALRNGKRIISPDVRSGPLRSSTSSTVSLIIF